MNERAAGMLGLCARARRLITGEKAVVQAIRAGACHVAVLDGSAAANAVDAVGRACAAHGVPLLRTAPGQLGQIVGRPGRMAAAVTDAGMAERLMQLCQPPGGRPPSES